MKKRIAMFLFAVAMVCTMIVPCFASAGTGNTAESMRLTLLNPTYIRFTGSSGTDYSVTVAEDVVGYNHITTGDTVKVCQAYCKITDSDPGTIDGIWGNNSETALRGAQSTMHDYGYSQVTSDGVCGPLTWRGFYSYHNGAPAKLKTLL